MFPLLCVYLLSLGCLGAALRVAWTDLCCPATWSWGAFVSVLIVLAATGVQTVVVVLTLVLC